MSPTQKRLIAAALSTGALALAAGAFAQDRAAAPGDQAAPGAHPFAERMREHWAEREAQQIKVLHDVLNIRADQETAFKAYAAALHPARDKAADAARKTPEPMAATTPERLDRLEARLQQRDQRMQARITAIKTFYAALNADQKHTFDSLPMLHSAFMERGRGGHGPGMMRGPDMRGGPGGPGRQGMGPPAQD